MRIRVFATLLATALLLAAPTPASSAADAPSADPVPAVATPSDDDVTRPTINEFYPEERPLGDCLSSLPKPDCGSEARGGWAQAAVFLAIVAGLAFIAWRIASSSRRARRVPTSAAGWVTPGTPDATTVRDGDGGVPAP